MTDQPHAGAVGLSQNSRLSLRASPTKDHSGSNGSHHSQQMPDGCQINAGSPVEPVNDKPCPVKSQRHSTAGGCHGHLHRPARMAKSLGHNFDLPTGADRVKSPNHHQNRFGNHALHECRPAPIPQGKAGVATHRCNRDHTRQRTHRECRNRRSLA